VTDEVSHPYKTTGKIKVLYILISKFLERRREDKRLWAERFATYQFCNCGTTCGKLIIIIRPMKCTESKIKHLENSSAWCTFFHYSLFRFPDGTVGEKW